MSNEEEVHAIVMATLGEILNLCTGVADLQTEEKASVYHIPHNKFSLRVLFNVLHILFKKSNFNPITYGGSDQR